VTDKRVRDQKIALGLLMTLCLGSFAAFIVIDVILAAHYGYGSGLTNRGHVPDEVAIAWGAQPGISAQELANRTKETGPTGLWNDTWRFAVTLIAMSATVAFWYQLQSKFRTI
jgi:hypothetical protein